MDERIKGDENMQTITMKELQERIKTNAKRSEETVERVTSEICRKDFRRGRVRPKHPNEERILARFNRK